MFSSSEYLDHKKSGHNNYNSVHKEEPFYDSHFPGTFKHLLCPQVICVWKQRHAEAFVD